MDDVDVSVVEAEQSWGEHYRKEGVSVLPVLLVLVSS